RRFAPPPPHLRRSDHCHDASLPPLHLCPVKLCPCSVRTGRPPGNRKVAGRRGCLALARVPCVEAACAAVISSDGLNSKSPNLHSSDVICCVKSFQFNQ
ncbi:unnamed protein product, partial [Urochloa humidicola]